MPDKKKPSEPILEEILNKVQETERDVDTVEKRVETVMRTVDELMAIVSRIEQKEDENSDILAKILAQFFPEPTSFDISQIGENGMPTNLSITAGQTGVFALTNLLPPGSALAAGNLPVWTADDPNVSLSAPAGITDGSAISAAVPATDTAASFNLTATYTRKTDGVVVAASVLVAIVPAGPPPAGEPTSFSIQQVS